MLLPFDAQAVGWAQSFATPLLDAVFKLLTYVGHPLVWVFVAAWMFWSRKEKEAFYLMTLVGVSAAISGVLKFAFHQPRPSSSEFRVLESNPDFGFPSGHASLAAAVFAFYERKIKPFWKWIAAILVILVAFSRLYLGAHFLSDVLGGIVIGLLVGKFLESVKTRTFHMRFKVSLLQEELALFALVVLSLAFIYAFEEWMLFALFLGYFFGYAFYCQLGLRQTGHSLERKLYGFAGLGVFFLGYAFAPTIERQFLALLVGGLWISFLYPLAVEAYLKPKKRSLTSDFRLGTERWTTPLRLAQRATKKRVGSKTHKTKKKARRSKARAKFFRSKKKKAKRAVSTAKSKLKSKIKRRKRR